MLHGGPVTIRRRRQGDVRFEPITPGGDRIAVIAAPSDIRGSCIEPGNGMNSPSSETLSTEDAVQIIGGRNTRGDKSDSPGRRNEILSGTDRRFLWSVSQPNCVQNRPPAPSRYQVPARLPATLSFIQVAADKGIVTTHRLA